MQGPKTAKYQVAPLWQQCEQCGGWLDPATDRPALIDYGTRKVLHCYECAKAIGYGACEDCGEVFKLADLYNISNNRHQLVHVFCRDCAEEAGHTFCDVCGEIADVNDCNGEYLCDECTDAGGWEKCTSCRAWTSRDDIRIGPNDEVYCEDCFCDTCSYCEGCGECFYLDDLVFTDYASYCSDCNPQVEDFDWGDWKGARIYKRIGSDRQFGVELETSSCPDHTELYDDPAWGAKDDPTVRGKEFVSTILHGDDGLAAIDRLCDFADNNGWTVNHTCGYHLHLNMESECEDSLEAIAIAYYLTYKVWTEFIKESRVEDCYCKETRADMSAYTSIEDWVRFARNTHRYEWVNWAAYARHGTLEVRLHNGTLDGEEVCNWIRAHTNFADWASRVGTAEVRRCLWCKNNAEKFDCMARVWQEAGCSDLADYYLGKVRASWKEDSVFAKKELCAS